VKHLVLLALSDDLPFRETNPVVIHGAPQKEYPLGGGAWLSYFNRTPPPAPMGIGVKVEKRSRKDGAGILRTLH
jgi:hypothetical protein